MSCDAWLIKATATATDVLIEVAGEQGNLDELRRLAALDNTIAAEQLAELEE